ERPFDCLALQLKADIEKEDHHQAVIDDEVKIDRMRAGPDADHEARDLIFKQVVDRIAERAVEGDERKDRRCDQDVARRRVALPPVCCCSALSHGGKLTAAPHATTSNDI